MPSNAFSLFDKKQLKSKIKLMSWSPKRDLLAMATQDGELLLYRLSSLERAWALPPYDSGSLINTICWRPDGNVVAVGHNTKEGGVRFVYMEKSEIVLHLNEEKSRLRSPATLLKWVEHSKELSSPNFASLPCKDYIPDLPKLPTKELDNVNVNSIVGASKFHMLLLCDENSDITLYAYGIFPILCIHCPALIGQPASSCRVTDMYLTASFQQVIFTISVQNNKPVSTTSHASVVDVTKTLHDVDACERAAMTACHLISTIQYMSNVLDCMNESCDTVIQEMETKLTCYLLNKPVSGTIGDELLHFLLWGKSSDVLRDFLTKCITEKGVVKLKKFVESSYASILQLLLINFQMASDAIYYHLVDVKGMEKPLIFGGTNLFNSTLAQESLDCAGSFVLKARELQHIVEQSQKNFAAFFRFLHYSWCKIQDSTEEQDTKIQISSHELEFVADFITESLIHEHEQLKASGKDRHFNFDKVYQYFQDAPLSSQLNTERNEWHRLVEATPSLADNPLIIKQRPTASLRQLFIELREKLQGLLGCPTLTASKESAQHQVLVASCSKSTSLHSCLWHIPGQLKEMTPTTYVISTTTEPPNQLLSFVKMSSDGSRKISIHFDEAAILGNESSERCTVSNFTFYDKNYITVLLATKSNLSILAQVPFAHLISEVEKHGTQANGSQSSPTEHSIDASKHVTHRSIIESLNPVKMAISGTRKVACLLGSDMRNIRTYNMEACSEDDDCDDDASMNLE